MKVNVDIIFHFFATTGTASLVTIVTQLEILNAARNTILLVGRIVLVNREDCTGFGEEKIGWY
jgi:hypothetical protein